MNEFFQNSVYMGVFLTLATYFLGVWIKKKLKWSVFNPLLFSIIATILVLIIGKVEYDVYYSGAKYISYFLTPATICLAIPLYEQFEVLKKNLAAVAAGILSGVLTSLFSILLFSMVFQFSHEEYVTFLPKSITTAIGMGVSEELGGYVAVTVAVIIITGVIGNCIASGFLKLLKIREPVARGIAIGTASHAIGTARAMELGEIEGALSSLSIVVAGLLTVVFSLVFGVIY